MSTFSDIIGRLSGYCHEGLPSAVAETGKNEKGHVTGELFVPLVGAING
ncbi:hypothetical protein [Secundilactobacillus collinoides]|nr:hypothetical protein [Secundilactobacillus collinoides]